MDRRQFLKLSGGGLVATATAAEVGLWAEFMSWLQRKPVWSFPAPTYIRLETFDQFAPIYYDRLAVKALADNFQFQKWLQVVNLPPTTGYKISLHRGPIPSA